MAKIHLSTYSRHTRGGRRAEHTPEGDEMSLQSLQLPLGWLPERKGILEDGAEICQAEWR